ncbi:MAG: hypothetical protein ACRYGI_05295 [Janthinobacterium lividum]
MNADVRRTSRVDWNDLRNLIEGEAIVLFGKQRIYTKLFTAMPDPNGMMHVTRSLTLPPPPTQTLREERARIEKIAGRLARDMAVDHGEERSIGPVIDTLLSGFGAALQDGKSVADSAMAAVHGVPPQTVPMTVEAEFASATGQDEVGPHDFDEMLWSAGGSIGKPAPLAAPNKTNQAMIAQLSRIEELLGQDPADARMAALQAVGERDAASVLRLPVLPPMNDDVLIGHIDALIRILDQPTAEKKAA